MTLLRQTYEAEGNFSVFSRTYQRKELTFVSTQGLNQSNFRLYNGKSIFLITTLFSRTKFDFPPLLPDIKYSESKLKTTH